MFNISVNLLYVNTIVICWQNVATYKIFRCIYGMYWLGIYVHCRIDGVQQANAVYKDWIIDQSKYVSFIRHLCNIRLGSSPFNW